MNPSLIHFGILLLAIACFLLYFSVVLMKKKNNPAHTDEPEEPSETPEPPVKETPLNPWEQHVAEEVERGALTPDEAALVHDMSEHLLPQDCDYRAMMVKLEQDPAYRLNATQKEEDNPQKEERQEVFRKYILKKFNRGVFRILKAEDEITEIAETIFTNRDLLPDRILSLYRKEPQSKIAIDMRWAHRLTKNGVSACRKTALARYKLFELRTGIPTFIILGIGGEPSEPEKLIVVPVRELTSSHLHHRLIEYYEKDPMESFRYDDLNRKLR